MGKKRANGEGSIRKRKDGRWEGFYTASYDPATGKQKTKNVLGKTQAEVKEKLKKAIADSQRLDMNRSGTHTVKSWVQMWYEVYAEPRLRENTKDYYLNYINNHIIPQLGDIKLDKLTTIQIQKFYNDLQKNGRVQRYQHIELKNKGLSVRVVHGIHTLLNNCLEQAVAERLILVNPARGCKLPKMEKREMKVLPEEKIRPYLMEADKRGLLAPFYLELTTGLRRGELLALLWTDLDVEKRTISITKQVTRTKGELVVSQPKTHNSIRVLPVSQQAVELLVEEHKKHPGNPYMFPSPKTGGMFDPDSFRHTHEKILKAIGAEHIRFHEGIRAYRVTITGMEGQKVMGQVIPLDYKTQVRRVQEQAIPATALTLQYESGHTIVVPYDGHQASLNTVRPGHGTIRTVQYEPDNEAELTRIIMVEHRHQTGKIKKAPKPGRSHPVR